MQLSVFKEDINKKMRFYESWLQVSHSTPIQAPMSIDIAVIYLSDLLAIDSAL